MTLHPTYRHRKLDTKWMLSLLAGLLLPLASPAAVILVIDISDPSQVTFTATNAHAQNNDNDSTLEDGFSLIGFFKVSVTDPSLYYFDVPSNLRSPGGNFAYSTLTSVNFEDPLSDADLDLSIFGSGFSKQNFSTGAPALTGSSTADLSDWLDFLPAIGATGNIYSGYSIVFERPLIGQYTVVPEPSAIGLIACGGLISFTRTKRR